MFFYFGVNYMWHNPVSCAMASVGFLIWDEKLTRPENLLLFAFAIHRFFILLNKANYMLVSLITAYKNKKQRFKMQTLIFILEFTVFLPITLGVLLVTTLLNTATVPLLGFAFFTIGALKPIRNWSAITPQ